MIDLLYYTRSLYKRFRLQTQHLSRMSKPFLFTYRKPIELDNSEKFNKLFAKGSCLY